MVFLIYIQVYIVRVYDLYSLFISSQSSGHFFDIFWPTSLPGPVRWCTPRTLTSPWWQRTALGAEGRNETGSPALKNTKVYSLQSNTHQTTHLETLHDLTRSCNYKRHNLVYRTLILMGFPSNLNQSEPTISAVETQPWRTFLDVNPLMTISSILRNPIWVFGTSVRKNFRFKQRLHPGAVREAPKILLAQTWHQFLVKHWDNFLNFT